MNFYSPPFGLSLDTYGLLLLFCSALFFSMMGCFVKLSSRSGIPCTELVFARAAFQTVSVIVFMCRSFHIDIAPMAGQVGHGEDGKNETMMGKEVEPKLLITMPLGKSRKVIPIVVARGFMGVLNFILNFYSMTVLPLGDAITLFSLYPVVTVFMARFFLGEQVRPSHIFAAFSTVAGAIMMAGMPTFLRGDNGEMEELAANQVGYLTAILCNFCAAGSMVLIKRAGELGAYTSQLFFSLSVFSGASALLLGTTIGLKVEGIWIAPPTAHIYWYIFGMCVTGLIDQLLLNFAGRFAPAGLGSIARSSDILWGYILEMVVFNEIPSWSTIVGVILILIALYTVSYEKMKDEQALILKEKESAFELGYKNFDIPVEKGEHA